MSIGKWVVVAFILFTIFIVTLVTVCIKQDISLVSSDYYKEELRYQDQIHRLNNTALLEDKPVIKVINRRLQIEFNNINKLEWGELTLFCPANSKMDRKFTIHSSPKPITSFDLDLLQKGMYKAKLLWRMDGKEFYEEEIVNI